MTGRQRLVESALLAALMETAPRVVLVGGEERGTWLLEQNMASEQPFAFGLVLSTEAAGSKGHIRFGKAAQLQAANDVAVPFAARIRCGVKILIKSLALARRRRGLER